MTGEALIFAGGRKRRERISCESFLCRLFNLIVVKLDNFVLFKWCLFHFISRGGPIKLYFFISILGWGLEGAETADQYIIQSVSFS